MKLAEARLRQFILETILLESANLNESAAAAARRMYEPAPAGSSGSSSSRSSSSRSSSSGYGRPSGYSGYQSRRKTKSEIQRDRDRAMNLRMSSVARDLMILAFTDYEGHVKKAYESGKVYMEWKEWLYHLIENKENIPRDKLRDKEATPQFIKKVGAKYEIDPKYVDDNDPAKFDNELIEKLKKRYMGVHDVAIGIRDSLLY